MSERASGDGGSSPGKAGSGGAATLAGVTLAVEAKPEGE